MKMSAQAERWHAAAEHALEQLKREHLTPGVALTLVWRDPLNADCYAVVTEDDPREVAALLLRAAEQPDPSLSDFLIAVLGTGPQRFGEIMQMVATDFAGTATKRTVHRHLARLKDVGQVTHWGKGTGWRLA
jgi:hypothetical protein